MKDWLKQKDVFEVKDVRQLKGNFLPSILKKAQGLDINKGLCIIQSFEPIPLYSALSEMGYEYHIEKISETEYRVYFFRIAINEISNSETDSELPFKPTAIVNFNTIDSKLADTVVNGITFGDKKTLLLT